MGWLSRVRNVLRGARVDRDLEDEIQFHLEARTEEFTRAGMSPNQARRRAIRQFGNPLVYREASRDIKRLPRLDSIVRDVGFGLRLCRRHKVMTGAAVISLSLAIGACTGGFSIVEALILRPLPVADPGSLIYVAARAPEDSRDGLSFSYPLFRDLREAARSSVALFALSDQSRRDATFGERGQPEKVYGQWISGDAFRILGVEPALGRLLEPSDDIHPGQHPAAVLSHEFWTRRFGQDPGVLGRWVTIREKPLQIVGVARKGFTGVAPGIRTDLWAPAMMWDDRAISDGGTRWLQIWGRLQPGVAPAQAQTVLQSVFTSVRREQAAARPLEARERIEQFLNTRLFLRSAANGPSAVREDFERPLWILVGVAGLVLLIACANVASLLVARARAREREMALRVAIGAGRRRLVQQVLIESALLALPSCVAGAALAAIAAPQVVSMLSTSGTIVHLDLQVNWRTLLFIAGIAGSVTCAFGLVPALRTSDMRPGEALKSGPGRQTAAVGMFRPLVAAQVAFGFVVLFAAGLCLTSFVRLLWTDLGFDQRNLVLVKVAASSAAEDRAASLSRWQHLLQGVERVSGIESASLSSWGLFEGTGRNKEVRISGQAIDAYRPWYLQVSPGFLSTMRIPLVAGRDIEWRDAHTAVPSAVIVNESFARRYFPGQSPLGQRFFRVDAGATLVAQEVIGVAADAKYTSLREPAPPTVYEAYLPAERAVVQVRTRLEAAPLADRLREEIARAHPAFRVGDVTLQSTLVGNHLVRDRVVALLSSFFSVVAVALVIVGVYGVLSYSVVRRTREIGIRLALGAQPARVVGVVLAETGAVTIAGLAVGVGAASFAGRWLAPLLFGVSPSDWWSIAAPLTAVLAACGLAAAVPAVRAARLDPTIVLRAE